MCQATDQRCLSKAYAVSQRGRPAFRGHPAAQRKGGFCSGDPKPPEVMWDDLSFVFQALRGYPGQWSRTVMGQVEVNLRFVLGTLASSEAARDISCSRFPRPNSLIFLFNHSSSRKKHTCDCTV